MPDFVHESLSLPFTGSTPMSRHCSLSGAKAATVRAGSQCSRMLVRYLERGPQSDGDQALALGLPEGRISARRSMLITKGLVVYVDIVQGPYGAKVTRWECSVRGQHVAARLAGR